jgi:hypothetical protein
MKKVILLIVVLVLMLIAGIYSYLCSDSDTKASKSDFVECLIDASKMIDFKIEKKAKGYFIKIREDKSFALDVRLAYLEASSKEIKSAQDQWIHFYISTGLDVPTGGPMPSLEKLNSMTEEDRQKLNDKVMSRISSDAREAKDIFTGLAPNCFKDI